MQGIKQDFSTIKNIFQELVSRLLSRKVATENKGLKSSLGGGLGSVKKKLNLCPMYLLKILTLSLRD